MFGFLKGKMQLELPKYNYNAGETLSGKIKLELKKPVEATKLTIQLVATRRVRTIINGRPSTRIEKVFDTEIPVRGEQPYSTAEFKFAIEVPKDAASTNGSTGAMGQIVKRIGMLSGQAPLEWHLKGRLYIKGLMNDISKKAKISIG